MYRKTRVRPIIELLEMGLSTREISTMQQVSRNTVMTLAAIYERCDRDWGELSLMSDDELYEYFYPYRFASRSTYARVDYDRVHAELKKKGVTEKLLWEEYCSTCKEHGRKPCCYATFANGYRRYVERSNYTSHVAHKPGEVCEVDWAGPTMKYRDRETGESVPAYIFVATFPYSHKTYVEAAPSMEETEWLRCHVNMFVFFGGTPVRVVCDNLRTGIVSHPKKGELTVNESYLSLCEYYCVAITPAGVKKPRHYPQS